MPDLDTPAGQLPAFSAVYVFGDSLVDPGNALRGAEFVDRLPFGSLPNGAPTAEKGYFEGRFTDGYNFADLISNKLLSIPTKWTFPFGFQDPVFDIPVPFVNRPEGASLSFAFGGSQVRQYGDAVPTLDDQTDGFRDLGRRDPNALHIITIGGNDLRQMVEPGETPLPPAQAAARMADIAEEIGEEVRQLFEFGARNVLIAGMPDIGILPEYRGSPNEAASRALASQYSRQLEAQVQEQLDNLDLPPDAHLYRFSLIGFSEHILADPAAHGLTNLTEARNVVQRGALEPVGHGFLFFDKVHPSAQAHALAAGEALDVLRGGGEDAPIPSLAGPRLFGDIGATGAVDVFSVSLVAGRSYVFDLSGISSGSGSLADPMLRLVGPAGAVLAQDDDNGLALDARLEFVAPASGAFQLQALGVGVTKGSYRLEAHELGGADLLQTGAVRGSDVTLLGDAGQDTLAAEGGVNLLRGSDGNDLLLGGVGFDDLHGNAGDDTVRGGAGNDWVVGGQGNDVVAGAPGDDLCLGGLGDDLVRGGMGDDSVSGGGGADFLAGDRGDDTLSGGAGADIFHSFGDAGLDLVTDFNRAEGDVVQLLPGTGFTVAQNGPDVMVNMTGGGQLVLANVQLSSLTGDWIVA